MKYAIPALPVITVPVVGGDPFPVRRIYCVGRNYAAHAREMGSDPTREDPFFFMKPADTIVPNNSVMPYPSVTKNLHHEIELVVALKSGGVDIPVAKANDCIYGYAVGLDMTRRDVQGQARDKGRPWDMGKGFDHSAPCTAIHPVSKTGIIDKGAIWLKVNGKERQKGDIADLIWNIPETINYLSGLVELCAGDLIYTGTPEGVGAVVKGDVLEGFVEGVDTLKITIG